MFVRRKGNSFYLVESKRVDGKVHQKVIQYLGINPVNGGYLPKLNVIHQGTVQEFLKKLPDSSCDCIIADPPYFISTHRTFTNNGRADLKRDFGAWDHGDFETFFEGWLDDCLRVLKHNLFLFTKFEKIQYFAEKYPEYYKSTLIWHKSNPAPHFQKNTFISACEPILFFQKKKGVFNFLEVNKMHNFIETPIEQRKQVRFHPTQKHEALIERLIEVGSNENGLVLDLFSGSGTTSRVAQRMNRNFIGIEEDIKHVQKARKILKQVR
jgi:site-specific DNA-methyltransferase (adenine-specific)